MGVNCAGRLPWCSGTSTPTKSAGSKNCWRRPSRRSPSCGRDDVGAPGMTLPGRAPTFRARRTSPANPNREPRARAFKNSFSRSRRRRGPQAAPRRQQPTAPTTHSPTGEAPTAREFFPQKKSSAGQWNESLQRRASPRTSIGLPANAKLPSPPGPPPGGSDCGGRADRCRQWWWRRVTESTAAEEPSPSSDAGNRQRLGAAEASCFARVSGESWL